MTNKQIDFITCVIGSLSLITGLPCSEIYKKLHSSGIMKDYLAPEYDVLHTFSLEYVAKDVMERLKTKGTNLC